MIYVDFTSPVNMNHYIWQWFNLLSVSKSSFAPLVGIAPIPNWFNMSSFIEALKLGKAFSIKRKLPMI